MIFIEVNLNEWLTTHPDLSLDKLKCKCGCTTSEVRPFVTKGYVGIKSEKCNECGRHGSSMMTSVEKYLTPR